MNEPSMKLLKVMETERLLLRPYGPDDAKMYLQTVIKNADSIDRAISGHTARIRTPEDAQEYFAQTKEWWLAGELFIMGILEKATGEYVGQFPVTHRQLKPSAFELGWFADRDHRGFGYITEAARGIISFLFEDPGTVKIFSRTSEDNQKSAGVAKRCGMVEEGRLRKMTVDKNGNPADELYFGILREEFNG